MKAAICTQYGGPEVIKLVEMEKPTIKANEILVKVRASALNSGDVRVRGIVVKGFMKLIMRLVLGFNGPRNKILGIMYAGEIEEVGDDVTLYRKGDRVFGMTGFKFGAHAEYLKTKETSNILSMPNNASFEEAASIIFGGHTAIYFLEKFKSRKVSSPDLLIIGATGSVGVAALQIAKANNFKVCSVCSSSGLELVRSLGTDEAIFYDKQDYLNIDKKFDFIFDAVGKSTKSACKHLLKPHGIYKTVGGLEMASETLDQLKLMKSLFEQKKYHAIIDKIYTLDQIVEAHRYVDTGRKKGNVVIRIS